MEGVQSKKYFHFLFGLVFINLLLVIFLANSNTQPHLFFSQFASLFQSGPFFLAFFVFCLSGIDFTIRRRKSVFICGSFFFLMACIYFNREFSTPFLSLFGLSVLPALLFLSIAFNPLNPINSKSPQLFFYSLIYFAVFNALVNSLHFLSFYKTTNPITSYITNFSYLFPFLGITLDMVTNSQKEQKALILLTETQELLAERKMELENANSDLVSSNEELSQANEKVSLIIETANDAFIAIDAGGDVKEWNRQAEKIFGWPRDEAVGKKLSSIVIPLEHRKKLESDIRSFFTEGKDPILNREMEVTALHRDGHEFPAELSISVLRQQHSYTFNAFVRDITERKKTAEEIQKRADELVRSNADLEQFAYVASHDLQEPLRMVSSYVQLLEKRYTGKLDTDALDFIHYAVDGVSRMQQLIRDLLEYSRVGRKEISFEEIDLNDCLEGVKQNLKLMIAESKAQIASRNLPTLYGDSVQFLQLLQNLISNAIKFRKPDLPSEILISAKEEGLNWVISIQDNGIGLESQYKDKIFVIFQRLHSRSDYPGTGIGLAVCKKIVERHGGKIWVESTLGVSTTFYFSIPKSGPKT